MVKGQNNNMYTILNEKFKILTTNNLPSNQVEDLEDNICVTHDYIDVDDFNHELDILINTSYG